MGVDCLAPYLILCELYSIRNFYAPFFAGHMISTRCVVLRVFRDWAMKRIGDLDGCSIFGSRESGFALIVSHKDAVGNFPVGQPRVVLTGCLVVVRKYVL